MVGSTGARMQRLSAGGAAHCNANTEIGVPGLVSGWGADFMSYNSTLRLCCQYKYIDIGLFVRTDWQLIGVARVTRDKCSLTDALLLAREAGST